MLSGKAAVKPKLKGFFHYAFAVWQPYLRCSNKLTNTCMQQISNLVCYIGNLMNLII